MARRTYYMITVNDGVELSDEIHTLREARKALKNNIEADIENFGESSVKLMDYHIMKYVETDDTIYESEVR